MKLIYKSFVFKKEKEEDFSMKNLLWKSKVQKKSFHEKAFFDKNWLIWSFYIIPPPLYLPFQSITLCPHLSFFFP